MEQKHRRVHGQTGRTHAVGALVKDTKDQRISTNKNPIITLKINMEHNHRGLEDHVPF